MKPLLEISDLSIKFKIRKSYFEAVKRLNLSIEENQVAGLVGESGSGKSVTAMSIMRLLPEPKAQFSAESSILFNGEDVLKASSKKLREIRGNDIAMIFQEPMTSLNPYHRVGDQIIESIQLHKAQPKSEAILEAKNLMSLVEISEVDRRFSSYPHELSGGQRQRIMIAMALANKPKLLIADEPTTALDVIVQDQILKEIKQIQKALNTSVIFISHDIAVVADVCKDICVMYAGQIVEKGTREEVFKSPKHPYTKTLLGSYLSLESEENIKVPEMRDSPDLITTTGVCMFAENCNCKSQDCKNKTPEWVNLSSTHQALCFEDVLNKDEND